LARLLLKTVTQRMNQRLSPLLRPLIRLDALGEVMMLKPDNRALRVLLWFVILFVPGGIVLLAWVAAETVHRRYREDVVSPDPELTNASLSGASLSSEFRSGA
jgi:cytochrome c-type biogenesis protein CcmH/NrfF